MEVLHVTSQVNLNGIAEYNKNYVSVNSKEKNEQEEQLFNFENENSVSIRDTQQSFFQKIFEDTKNAVKSAIDPVITDAGESDDKDWDGILLLDNGLDDQGYVFIQEDKAGTKREISVADDKKTFTVKTYNLKGDNNFETPDKVATYKVVQSAPYRIKNMNAFELAKYKEEHPKEFNKTPEKIINDYLNKYTLEVVDVKYNNDDENFSDYLKSIYKPDIDSIKAAYKRFVSDDSKEVEVLYDEDKNILTVSTYCRDVNGVSETPDRVQKYEVRRLLSDWVLDMSPIEFEKYKLEHPQAFKDMTQIPILNLINQKDYIDSDIEYFSQGGIGDCAFLASIYSITQSEEGQKIIDEAISKNNDGSYNVCFKGIDKTYTVTQDELTNAKIYSKGDNTIQLLELAAEKALNEIMLLEPNFPIYSYKEEGAEDKFKIDANRYNIYQSTKSRLKYNSEDDPLITGFSLKDFALLFDLHYTNVSWKNFRKTGMDLPHETIYEIMQDINLENSIGYFGCFRHEDILESDNNETFKIMDEHAYAIKSYDSKNHTVTIVNPHKSWDSLTIDIGELIEYCPYIEYYDKDDIDYE